MEQNQLSSSRELEQRLNTPIILFRKQRTETQPAKSLRSNTHLPKPWFVASNSILLWLYSIQLLFYFQTSHLRALLSTPMDRALGAGSLCTRVPFIHTHIYQKALLRSRGQSTAKAQPSAWGCICQKKRPFYTFGGPAGDSVNTDV